MIVVSVADVGKGISLVMLCVPSIQEHPKAGFLQTKIQIRTRSCLTSNTFGSPRSCQY